ncbi:uncharacterized protein LOC142240707 [Haematobia irritans]|uniref:uncharacterized protein LOC142240707 n=1 Tax=Haematobia irritans TaxID=7368 RepID=UPI003F5096FB
MMASPIAVCKCHYQLLFFHHLDNVMSSIEPKVRAYQAFLKMLLILALFVAVEGNKKCAELDEYCINHWECCSNSCLSYKYRCVRTFNVYPYPFLGASTTQPSMTLNQLLEMNFGSQNTNNVNTKSSHAAAIGKGISFAPRFNVEENALADEETTVNIVLLDANDQQVTSEIPSTTVVSEVSSTPTPAPPQPSSTTTTSEEPCKEIGSKCFHNSECCSQLCHGFLHQCVT